MFSSQKTYGHKHLYIRYLYNNPPSHGQRSKLAKKKLKTIKVHWSPSHTCWTINVKFFEFLENLIVSLKWIADFFEFISSVFFLFSSINLWKMMWWMGWGRQLTRWWVISWLAYDDSSLVCVICPWRISHERIFRILWLCIRYIGYQQTALFYSIL